jgi:prepilin-type N-terminal cleavage/methylation domain-containing protein
MKKQKQGFTLIELLVVIAIIGILSAIGLVALNGAREKARDAQRRSDLAQIKTALTLYYDDRSPFSYPVSSATAGTGVKLTTADELTIVPEYLGATLTDPTNDATHGYWYVGNATATPVTRYALYTHLEAGAANTYAVNDIAVVTPNPAWPATFGLTEFGCGANLAVGKTNLCP